MHLTLSRILAVIFLLNTALWGSEITIRVYDYAGIEPDLLQQAREQAARILKRAGVPSRWEQCPTSGSERGHETLCLQPAGPGLIQLRVLPGNMSRKIASAGIQFGYSLPSDRGFGVIAGVYLDRTLSFARAMGISAAVVLGHTMAHEIGHLLLGSNSHARQGIMRPTWDGRDIQLAVEGVLGFTPSQAKLMREKVALRLTTS